MNKPNEIRLTDADYADMAADYAANPITANEVISVEINSAYLRTGRPVGKGKAKGKTPGLPVRLPEPIRAEMRHRVAIGGAKSESELVRVALLEYFEHHPTS